jgi:hypothetical protein
MPASAVPVLPVLDLVGEVVLGPAPGESDRPKFLAPGGDEGHDEQSSRQRFGGIVPPAPLDGAGFAHQLLTTGIAPGPLFLF